MISDIAYPRQVILVSSRCEVKSHFKSDKEVFDNIFALSWHSPVSFNPELYAIIVGKERFSFELIKNSQCFVVNFMSSSFKEAILGCGSSSGQHVDKWEKFGLSKQESDSIDCPRIKEAFACFECEVVDQLEVGDHVIFVGKILKTVSNSDGKRLFQKGNKFLEV